MVGTASGLWHVARGRVTVGTFGTLADAVIIRELPVCHSEIIKKKKINVHFFERERETERVQGRGRERGRHRIRSRLHSLSCQHRA